ncbi:winged helix-turn-helix transcriptional regulator [Streptomyces beijiangensis]|uniref:Helix-turn-helix transcriptional regulator n=1 Tax=Streptomyces beijiangensis TaxID=163361 RepID=A0A939F6H7_9ACTN|nr:helix-turn-helix domain-containing protein [Streptomyces beijiangensis]MBO0513486.1 helix-turn-helix transcriptional regulator [Streptomyces beijiangensis]
MPEGNAAAVLDRVGGKWSVTILLIVCQEPHRFTELEHVVEGISRRMLALTLRALERDGLITRTVHPSIPVRVEYSATAIALELRESLRTLADWALRHRAAIAEARTAYDDRATARPDRESATAPGPDGRRITSAS